MSKVNVELSRKSKETPWGFHTMDAGGDGDCGYRALAAALKLAAGDPPEKAKANAAKHGASLRARAATWIKKKGKFKDSFAVDDKWTEQMEAGPIPQTYDEWVESCARPRTVDRRTRVHRRRNGAGEKDSGFRNSWMEGGVVWHFTKPHESDANANMDGPQTACVTTVLEGSTFDHCNPV